MSVLGKILTNIDKAKQDGTYILNLDNPPKFYPYTNYIIEYKLPENSVWKVGSRYDNRATLSMLYIDGTPEITMKLNGKDLTVGGEVYDSRTDITDDIVHELIQSDDNRTILIMSIEEMDDYYPYEDSFTITELTIDGTKYPDETISYVCQNCMDETINMLPTVRTLKNLVPLYTKT